LLLLLPAAALAAPLIVASVSLGLELLSLGPEATVARLFASGPAAFLAGTENSLAAALPAKIFARTTFKLLLPAAIGRWAMSLPSSAAPMLFFLWWWR